MRVWVVLTVAALAACNSGEESTTIGGTTFSGNEAQGTATIANERGSITALEGAAAADIQFPDFAPQYPGSQVDSALVSDTERGKRTNVVLATDDPVERVAEFYRDKFTSAGLAIGTSFASADGMMLTAEEGGRKASAAGGVQDGKTTFTLTFSGD